MLQYTGGTTGIPKGAMLTHANLSASCAIYDAWFNPQSPVRPGEARAICALPLFHIFALSTVMLRHLSNGNEVLLRQKFDVETTLADIEIRRATHLNGVPTMWMALCNCPGIEKRDLSSLVACSSGGDALPVEIVERWQRAHRESAAQRHRHDGDVARRRDPADHAAGQARLVRPAIAGRSD